MFLVEVKYGVHGEQDIQDAVTKKDDPDALHSNARSGSLHIRHVAETYEKGCVLCRTQNPAHVDTDIM